jgi:hypothetical protein
MSASASPPKADIAERDYPLCANSGIKESKWWFERVLGLRQGVSFDLSQCTGGKTILRVRR